MEWNIYCTKYVYVLFGLGFEKYTFEKYDMKNINETKKKKNYVQYSTDLNKKFDNKRTIIYVKIFLLLYFNEKKKLLCF